MTAILIAAALIGIGIGIFIGALITAANRADTDHQISALRWHLRSILNEAYSGQIQGRTLEAARRTLYDDENQQPATDNQ